VRKRNEEWFPQGSEWLTYRESWVEDMIKEDRHEVEEPSAASGRHCVTCMIRVCPRVCTRRKATVSQQVKHTLQHNGIYIYIYVQYAQVLEFEITGSLKNITVMK